LIQAIAKARRVETLEAEKILVASATEPAGGPPPLPEAPSAVGAPQAAEDPLAPLDDELGALGGPVAAAPKPVASTAPVDQKSLGEVLSTPLSRLVSEIRRSFDYYEHQLYEQPVERLILSGGVAHLPILRDVLRDDLGVAVELADPTQSALVLGSESQVSKMYEHPSQFMVAVGLAARGIAEL
jgi:Tfp pilus assembly PilM family ATPase